jgi:hypothetical protein
MKFFVPYTGDDTEAERVWATARADLFDQGLPTTRRRIQALSLHHRGGRLLLKVGMDVPDAGEPVMIILEASNLDVFYVLTPLRGVIEGSPYVLGLDEEGRALDFDESE